jgi:hypothetical protein
MLTEMRADGLLDLQYQQPPYGPRYICTERGQDLRNRYPRTLKRFHSDIKRIAAFFADRGVAELERLSTALYVTRACKKVSVPSQVDKIVKIKPHIQRPSAKSALKEVLAFLKTA